MDFEEFGGARRRRFKQKAKKFLGQRSRSKIDLTAESSKITKKIHPIRRIKCIQNAGIFRVSPDKSPNKLSGADGI